MNQKGESSIRGANTAQQDYLEALLFLLRCEHHDHLTTFDLRREGFDNGQFRIFTQVFTDAVKHFHTDLLVRHFTPTEPQGDFGFIAIFQKANQVA